MKKRLNPKIPCPELLGINLTVDAACRNEKCGKPVATIPRERERETEREGERERERENCDMQEL